MKNKLKTFGIVILSMVGVILLFITIVGIGNYFQGIGQKLIGNIFMILFPFIIYFAVKFFNRKINGLHSKQYGFGFKDFTSNFLLGIGVALAVKSLVLLIAKVFFDIDIEFSGLKKDFQIPLMEMVVTLVIVGIWEEFYFRGLVFNTFLKSDFGFHLSALISSILFSIIHYFSFGLNENYILWFLGIIFIGYILVFFYVYTNSIWSVVSFHFIWNFIETLQPDSKNKIGLFEVSNFLEHSNNIKNINVVCLGILLLIILVLDKRIAGNRRIKSYVNEINAANN